MSVYSLFSRDGCREVDIDKNSSLIICDQELQIYNSNSAVGIESKTTLSRMSLKVLLCQNGRFSKHCDDAKPCHFSDKIRLTRFEGQ